jgi:MtfA peptidase
VAPMASLLGSLRRKRILSRPFPVAWHALLERRHPFYRRLSPADRERFQQMLTVFLAEKAFVGAGGLEVTEEMRLVVAAIAIRLVLHLHLGYYDRLVEIVLYPESFRHPDDRNVLLGEATRWGTVVLSWPAVQAGLADACDGHETATHEFAHVLDGADGSRTDGIPPQPTSELLRLFTEIMGRQFARLQAGDHAALDVMRPYGAWNEGEFFAVATEAFFERSRRMKEEIPDLYAVLCRFYGFDPAADDACDPEGPPAA